MSVATIRLFGLVGILGLCLGVSLLVYVLLTDHSSVLGSMWHRYVAKLDYYLDRLTSDFGTDKVLMAQGAIVALLIAIWLYTGVAYAPMFSVFIPFATFALFEGLIQQRCNEIVLQLDGWLTLLANMMKASGNVESAVRSTVELTRAPLSKEVEFLLRRVDVGNSLEDALELMYQRVPSPGLRTVVTSLRVGRKLGGDLPKLLDENAASLRESERVERYIRSQVAQGRMQLIVLGVAPIFVVTAFSQTKEGFFTPLLESPLGPILIGVALFLWVTAIFVGAKIMKVNA